MNQSNVNINSNNKNKNKNIKDNIVKIINKLNELTLPLRVYGDGSVINILEHEDFKKTCEIDQPGYS